VLRRKQIVVSCAIVGLAAAVWGGWYLLAERNDPNACVQPLRNYCRDCPTYENALNWVEAFKLRVNSLRANDRYDYFSAGNTYSMGTCGQLRFVDRSGLFTGESLYFDGDGELVAAVRWTDHGGGRCGLSRHFGRTVDCERRLDWYLEPPKLK